MTIQYPIQVGHKTKLADIVVFSNGTEQFVIEVKRPGHTICPEDEKQMFSYTRLLNNHVFYLGFISEMTSDCTMMTPSPYHFLNLYLSSK
ncbi:MAG: type I restriction enzyme HsdR N-terminal domain-containing protein [Bacteroidales bacterium]|nr:type I restriction enzyme HsdR N-terminal domain-containing protein [Bacteroidales bacterium]